MFSTNRREKTRELTLRLNKLFEAKVNIPKPIKLKVKVEDERGEE